MIRHEHLLVTSAIRDAHGTPLEPQVPAIVVDPNRTGGLVEGKVLRGDGTPAAGSKVQLLRYRKVVNPNAPEGEQLYPRPRGGSGCRSATARSTSTSSRSRRRRDTRSGIRRTCSPSPSSPASRSARSCRRAPIRSCSPRRREEVSTIVRLQNRLLQGQHRAPRARHGQGAARPRGRRLARDGRDRRGREHALPRAAHGSARGGRLVHVRRAAGRPDHALGPRRRGQPRLPDGRHPEARRRRERDAPARADRAAEDRHGVREGDAPQERQPAAAARSVAGRDGRRLLERHLHRRRSSPTTSATRRSRACLPERSRCRPRTSASRARPRSRTSTLAADATVSATLTLAEAAPRSVVGRVLFHDGPTNTNLPVSRGGRVHRGPGQLRVHGRDGDVPDRRRAGARRRRGGVLGDGVRQRARTSGADRRCRRCSTRGTERRSSRPTSS